MTTTPDFPQGSGSLLAFRLAERLFALPLADIRRAVSVPLLAELAGAPRFVEGIFDFAGEPVAALRLDRLLHLEDVALGIYSVLLILRGTDPSIALHVAAIDAILGEHLAIQPVSETATFNACVTGRLSRSGETVYVLSAGQLLLSEERQRVSALLAFRNKRLNDRLVADSGPEGIAHAS